MRGEAGTQEVTTFFRKELRLSPALVCWQRRILQYLSNRCGHRFCEERGVCQAHEEDLAAGEESCEEEFVSDEDITKAMTLAPSRQVASALRHRPGLAAINTGPASQAHTLDGTHTQQTLSLSRPLCSNHLLSR